MWWEPVIQSLANVFIFGLAAYYIQNLINKSATNQINQYKSELDTKLAEHKSNLERMTFKYSKFHEKRLDVLSNLYSNLAELHIYAQELTAVIKPIKEDYDKEELERMHKAFQAFIDVKLLYEKNKIYLNEKTSLLFRELIDEYYENFHKHNYAQKASKEGDFVHTLIKEIQVSMQKKIPIMLRSLEEEIKGLISIEN